MSCLPDMEVGMYPRLKTSISPFDFLAEMYSMATTYITWKKTTKPMRIPTLRHLWLWKYLNWVLMYASPLTKGWP